MNNAARSELIRQLEHMKHHGSRMSMLVMTVRNTSNGLLAGLNGETLSLDYPKAGWLDVARACKFKVYCKSQGYPISLGKWGKERVIRACVGSDISHAADAIDGCFEAVYAESGAFGLELRGLDWQPSDTSSVTRPSRASQSDR